MTDAEEKLEEMRAVNERQKQYYEHTDADSPADVNSVFTNSYRILRNCLLSPVRDLAPTYADIHRSWLPEEIDRVLDLGPGSGNELSLHLAERANEYIAAELSEVRAGKLRKRINSRGLEGQVIAEDFLSSDFPHGNFDLVYAKSVVHHFEHTDAFLKRLASRTVSGATVLTFDPLATWTPIRLFRAVYRHVQSDAEWEHPFTEEDLDLLQSHFRIEEVQGFLGKSKWAMPIGLFSENLARQKARNYHAEDLEKATDLDSIETCLRVALCLRKKSTN